MNNKLKKTKYRKAFKKIFKKIFKGKRSKDQKINDLQISLFITFTGLLILFCLILQITTLPGYMYDDKFPVNYDKVCIDSQEYINQMLDDLKPEYKKVIKNITFTTNRSYIDKIAGVPAYGVNDYEGNIAVYIDGDEERERYVICHEILHSIVKRWGLTDDEWFVRDIADYGVCYDKSQQEKKSGN